MAASGPSPATPTSRRCPPPGRAGRSRRTRPSSGSSTSPRWPGTPPRNSCCAWTRPATPGSAASPTGASRPGRWPSWKMICANGRPASCGRRRRQESGDFVADVACHLPLQAIAGLMGFPDADREQLIHWSDQMAATEDPEYGTMDQTATFELLAYAYASAEERKVRDLGDVTSRLVRPDASGQTLSSEEYGFFFMILAVAGNETTRQAIAHGMLAFLEHPDQWERWRGRSGPRPPSTRSSATPRRPSCSSARPPRTPRSAATPSPAVSGWACTSPRPTSTRTVYEDPAGSTSAEAPIRT